MTNEAGTNVYTATRFGYAMNGRTLTYAHGETWTWDGVSSCPTSPTNYAIPWAREFRYDGARARYLKRELDPAGLFLSPQQFNSLTPDVWTDYDGDEAYGDYSVDGTTATNLRSYQPGMAIVDPWMSSGNTATDYFLKDHLGTTRGLTLATTGSPADAVTYSAFGEKVSGTDHRFGYVGEFGYQAHSGMPYLHVGARYYDPLTGRFLQRDPIGIFGGQNSYLYVRNLPAKVIDPSGREPCPTCGHDPDDDVSIDCGPISVSWGWLKDFVDNRARDFREFYYRGWWDRNVNRPIDKAIDRIIDVLPPYDPGPPQFPRSRGPEKGDFPPPLPGSALG